MSNLARVGVRELRQASFTLDYSVHNGRRETDAVVATAETLMVPYDLDAQRPRRLTEQERGRIIALARSIPPGRAQRMGDELRGRSWPAQWMPPRQRPKPRASPPGCPLR